MNSKKKLLSLVTAAAISASAFTGFAISANAEQTSVVSYDFETGDPWTESGTDSGKSAYATDIVDDTTLNSKVLHTALDNQSGGRQVTLNLPATITPTENVVKVEFDWYSKTVGTNNSTDTVLVGTDGTQIFSVSDVVANDSVTVSGTSTGLARGYYKVSAVIDFETKQVITVSFTANGAEKAAKTLSNIKFIDNTATDIAGVYLSANRTTNISLDWRMDNFAVSTVTGEHFKVTLNVKTSAGDAVADANVKIGDTSYSTDENGQVVTKLPVGEYTYTVSKAGYEATTGEEDDATGTITVSTEDVITNVTYSQQVYTPVPGTVTMEGGQTVMTAPHTEGKSVTSKEYTVTVADQKNVPLTDAEITWTILPTGSETADSNVTIADGVITVTKGFTAGDTHVKNFTVTATATKNDESKSATATIDISDYLFYEPGIGGSSYGDTNTAMLNTNGTNIGTESYIATPATKGTTEKIVLPDPITFTAGTAQLLSFKTTVQNTNGYTFQRTVSLVDSNDTNIVQFGYINLDIGDSATATWSSSTSSFTTTWGSIPSLNTWVDVTLLFKTNANNVTKVTLTVNENEIDLGETDATDLASITTYLGLNTVNRYALLKDIIVSEVDVTGIDIDGPTEFSTISGQTVTKDYAVDAMVIEDGETFEWTTTIPGATITADAEDSQKATLTVPGTTTEGGTITLTSSVSTEDKPKTATIDVTVEPAKIASATINGSATLDKTAGTAAYTVSDVTDQFGDDVTEYFTPVWSVNSASQTGMATFTVKADEAGAAVAITAEYNDDKSLKSVKTEDVTLAAGENTVEVTAPTGAKVMLWDKLDGMKPLADAQTASAGGSENAEIDPESGELTITDNGDVTVLATLTNGDNAYPFEKTVKIDTYSVIEDYSSQTAIDISPLVKDDDISGYRVTVADADGVKLAQSDVDTDDLVNDTVAVPDLTEVTGTPAKIEVAPIFTAGTIASADLRYTFTLPPEAYEITVTASGSRADLLVNGQMVKNNMLQYGSAEATRVSHDVIVNEGYAQLQTTDYSSGSSASNTPITQLVMVKEPSIVTRTTKIYVLGDSLVAEYYNDADTMTGWGQVLQSYISDGYEVVDIANSGADTTGIKATQMSRVLISGQEGDYMVLESGYNDKGHYESYGSPTSEEYQQNLRDMAADAKAKGINVVFVSPNASAHDYKESVAWTTGMEEVAEDTETNYIDLSQLSYDFLYDKYGADYTAADEENSTARSDLRKVYNVYRDSEKGLHSTVNGANCWAAIMASELNRIFEIGTTDYEYTFNDGTNDITISVASVTATDDNTGSDSGDDTGSDSGDDTGSDSGDDTGNSGGDTTGGSENNTTE